jgi:hypothetical protein
LGNAGGLPRPSGALLVIGLILLTVSAARAACVDPAALKPARGAFEFRQTRYLKATHAPLVSQGVATVSPGRVEWRVTRPIDVVTVITKGGVTQSIEGGPAQPVGGSSNVDPLLRSLGLLQIVSGDFAGARTNYDVETEPHPPGAAWKLTLRPKDRQVSRFLDHIEIAGCDRPAEVDIFQANGDRTRLEWAPRK